MKKVLHIIATNFFGGPEKQVLEHLIRLNDGHWHGALASFLEHGMNNEIIEKARLRGITTYGIPMEGPLDFRAFARLRRILRCERWDLLCAHGYKSVFMGWLAAQNTNTRVLGFSRGYTAENRKVSFYEWLERRIIPRLDGIVCVSKAQQRRLESFGVRPKLCWMVYNAISPEDEHSGVQIDTRELHEYLKTDSQALIVTAGRLSPEKGHRFLLEAVSIMGEMASGSNFLFYGEGPCRGELERLSANLGISDRCRFMGFSKNLSYVFKAMDMFVLPSLTEGLPNVVLEAFAWGKPVVASAVGGVAEIVLDGINGCLVPPGQPAILAKKIGTLLANPTLRQRMGKTGLDIVRRKFTFEEQNEKLKEIYCAVLGE